MSRKHQFTCGNTATLKIKLSDTPEAIIEQAGLVHLDGRRRDRLGAILHEYERAA